MPKTIVGVNYKNKYSGEYDSRVYSYYCELDAKGWRCCYRANCKGDSVAGISEVNVPESRISGVVKPLAEKQLPLMRKIRKEPMNDRERTLTV